jgi:hypothetical protein
MVVVPFPSTLPSAVAQALADDSLGSARRGLLRRLCGDDIDDRAAALLELMEFEVVDDPSGRNDGDDGEKKLRTKKHTKCPTCPRLG